MENNKNPNKVAISSTDTEVVITVEVNEREYKMIVPVGVSYADALSAGATFLAQLSSMAYETAVKAANRVPGEENGA